MLVQKPKRKEVRQVKPCDIVIVGNDSYKRLDWPLGKITEMFPGKDGCTRVLKDKDYLCAIIFAANLLINRGVKFVMTSSQQTCFASGLVDSALLLCRKFVSKLPHHVCHDKLISRKIKLAASVHAIWVSSSFTSELVNPKLKYS
ncbi:hypothetical protein AVEN_266437-1 [Araneus ventricosus]|uniref:DUF5641 domain-containing protein n=1 Tax=Araneus ventricosus TaxID=182803 RepID=A0A4Y2G750_ARAVE|nr:hypothetical protein AVEN_266437-1 [Araneus ventricosus]